MHTLVWNVVRDIDYDKSVTFFVVCYVYESNCSGISNDKTN